MRCFGVAEVGRLNDLAQRLTLRPLGRRAVRSEELKLRTLECDSLSNKVQKPDTVGHTHSGVRRAVEWLLPRCWEFFFFHAMCRCRTPVLQPHISSEC